MYLRFKTRYQRNSNDCTHFLGGPAFERDLCRYRATKPEVDNPRWRPLNFYCAHFCSQTRYQRNSNGYTYVFGVQLSIGTYKNLMRPNWELKNPRWRPLNFKCMYLLFQTRNQRNYNGYTFIFGVKHSIGTHKNTMRPNRKWKAHNFSQLRDYMTCFLVMTPI